MGTRSPPEQGRRPYVVPCVGTGHLEYKTPHRPPPLMMSLLSSSTPHFRDPHGSPSMEKDPPSLPETSFWISFFPHSGYPQTLFLIRSVSLVSHGSRSSSLYESQVPFRSSGPSDLTLSPFHQFPSLKPIVTLLRHR